MTCAHCIAFTPELQTIDLTGHCPRCGRDYTPWTHSPRVATAQMVYNTRTRKLISNGNAYRDRLVAARLALRSTF